jgi:hypothetical protein
MMGAMPGSGSGGPPPDLDCFPEGITKNAWRQRAKDGKTTRSCRDLISAMDVREYTNRFCRHQQLLDLMFVGTYLVSAAMDAFFTFFKINHYGEEANQFVAFMMERYGVGEGLLRTQGIEALQLAALLGMAHLAVGLWKSLKKKTIDMQVRFTVIYVYAAVGIVKHIQGILSWL